MLYVLPILIFQKGWTSTTNSLSSVKSGPGYLIQIYLVQIYGMSIFMKCEDLVLKFGFDFGFVSFRFDRFRFVSIGFVSFRFDFVSHFTGTPD
jgi:hypothetical protein